MEDFREQLPCPMSGGLAYSWGKFSADSLRYRDKNEPSEALFADGSIKVISARRCTICGNLQLFAQGPFGVNR